MIICRGTNDTDSRHRLTTQTHDTDSQLFTSLFRDKLSLQGARIHVSIQISTHYCKV